MKIRVSSLFMTTVLILTATFVSSAQSSQQNWDSIKNLTIGTNLIVETKNRETIRGTVSGVTDSALNLSNSGNITTLNENEIAKIYLTKKRSRIKGAFLGAGIGAAAVLPSAGFIRWQQRETGWRQRAG